LQGKLHHDDGTEPVSAGGDGLAGWSPMDYLLRGDFCPTADLSPALEALRRSVGARTALLMVAGSRGLLRTLCTCVSTDGSETVINDFLRAGPKVRLKRRRALVALPDDVTAHHPTDPRWHPDAVIARLKAVAERKGRDDVVGALGPAEEWVAVRAPVEMDRMPMTVAVYVRTPVEVPVGESKGQPAVECDEAVLRLAVMASTTATTSVYHDTMITTRVDERLSRQDSGAANADLRAATQQLIELAAEVTDSVAVCYYVVDPINRELRQVAAHVPDELEATFPDRIGVDDPVVAAQAVGRRRPLVHGWAGSRTKVSPTMEFSAAELPPYVELATPVPGPLASPRVACGGVVTAVRVAESGQPVKSFGAYDHSLLRNVALRLALLHATEDMEAAADMFRDLTIRQSGALASASSARARLCGGKEADIPPLADDVVQALPSIEAALAEVARLTNSHSATFRLAQPLLATSAAHGLGLVRIAAHSKDGLLDPRPVQDVTEPGINCRAALSGRPQNVPFVDLDRGYDAVRPHTRSQISVPVAVEGMVIGTVNLESPVERNYDARVSTAIAFAEHVGMVFAGARLSLARELHQYATQIVTRAHDLSAETRQIARATAGAPPVARRKVGEAIARIEERARGIGSFDSDDERRAPATMPTLASEAWRRANLLYIDRQIEERAWGMFGETTTAVYDCLRHVFVNVQSHMPIDAEAPPEVRVSSALWGGRRYDIVRVRNEAKERIDPARAANLYQVPVVDHRPPSRGDGSDVKLPRFGAYLAGIEARTVGGNVHFALEEPEMVRIMVMIPAPAPGQDDG
jgi:GAF domain